MTTIPGTLHVYAEHCTRSAQPVSQAEIDAAESPSDDWIEVDLSEAEAAWYETHRGRFGRRVAITIRDYIKATAAPAS